MTTLAPFAASSTQRLDVPTLLSLLWRAVLVAGCSVCGVGGPPGCSLPPVKLEDCEATCEKGACPGGLTCRDGYCVHEGSESYCGSADDGEGGEAGIAGYAGAAAAKDTGSLAGGGVAGDEGGGAGPGDPGGAGGECGGGGTCDGGEGGCAAAAPKPVVTQVSLDDACLGEVLDVELTATGGGNYAWSAALPPELGLKLSKDGILSGVLATPGEFSFDVAVRDTVTECASAVTTLWLTVGDDSFEDCPTIMVKDKTTSSPAPASCRAWPYSTGLVVSGGAEPYYWVVRDIPPGLDFDSLTQRVTGTATADGTLTVEVTDGNGRVVQRSFPIPLREKCWFSHLSTESGASRLNLVDPLLGVHMQRPSSASTELSVEDFQFSPDGSFLAYRVKDALGSQRLWLWKGPEWTQEKELDLGGSVTHYAWSRSGLVLAAAIKTADDTWLGGVDVSLAKTLPGATSIQGLRPLKPVSAPVDSEIAWYGEDGYVAFDSSAALGPEWRVANQASYESSGFTDVTSWSGTSYMAPLSYYPSDSGIFVFAPDASRLEFLSTGEGMATVHGNVAVAPDGAFVAFASDEQVSVYRARDTTDPPVVAAWGVGVGCSSLLAWTSDRERERLACVDRISSTIKVHTMDPVTGNVSSSTVQGSEVYVDGVWQGFPRVFSPSGDYIALAAADRIYVGSLNSAVHTLRSIPLRGAPTPSDISFSPNEQLIMVHRGASILLTRTTVEADSWGEDDFYANVLDTGDVPTACEEEQLAHANWCGRAQALRQPVWSADSRLLGVVQSDSSLVVLDLGAASAPVSVDSIVVASDCQVGCVGTGKFQP